MMSVDPAQAQSSDVALSSKVVLKDDVLYGLSQAPRERQTSEPNGQRAARLRR